MASRFRLCPYHRDSLGWDACSDGFVGCQIKSARKRATNKIVVKSGYIIVPIKSENGKDMQPNLFNAWTFPQFGSSPRFIMVYRTRFGAEKAQRKILGSSAPCFKVMKISMMED